MPGTVATMELKEKKSKEALDVRVLEAELADEVFEEEGLHRRHKGGDSSGSGSSEDHDPNLDDDEAGDYEDDSPYPEVRSAVANTDDVNMPVGTIRAWVIGLMWAVLIPGLNQ